MYALRDYQAALLDGVRASYRTGHRRPCLVAPCGAGKSVIVAEMARLATAQGNRVLFLVHRKELCAQIERTFCEAGVDMRLCMVGMVQTVRRRLDRIPAPDLIITDENHHSKAASYRAVYDAFPDARCVGVTATPVRLDGSGLGDVNDDLVVGASAKWLIAHERLAPYRYYAPTLADLSGVSVRRGEFVAAEAEPLLIGKAIFGDAIGHYRALAGGVKAICYCATVRHSRAMAEAFCAAGIPAAHLDGETPPAQRERTVEEFRTGKLVVLCNVDLISEGFDVPDCGCAILLRPTHSLTLYVQQSMRCMRYLPGKTAVIIDHVGNYARHGLPDDDREWTLAGRKGKKGRCQQNQVFVKQCPACYAVLPSALGACPECGYVYPPPDRSLEEIKEARLERIEGFALHYDSPADCRNYQELLAYAKRKGYKPGWAFYQARERGFVQ